MEDLKTIDITTLVHSFKNMIILNRLDHLAEGQSLILQNNADLLPLYYRLLVERGAIFGWEYLKRGPQVWKVKLSKLKLGEEDRTISEVVTRDYRKKKVLEDFGIAVTPLGKKTLERVCQEKNINLAKVVQALKEVDQEPISPSVDYNTWNLDFLLEFIVNIQHGYVARMDPELHEYLQKISEVHATRHFEVIDVTRGFIKISSELKQHLRKEETVLFPHIRKMIMAKRENLPRPQSSLGSVSEFVKILEREHNNILYEIKEIEISSNHFAVPEDGDALFRRTYTKLKAFLDELELHLHLENNILFPKAIILEKELKEKMNDKRINGDR